MQMKSVSKVQFGQLYNTKFLSCGWKATKELIKNGSWKCVPLTMDSFMVIL